MKIIKIRQFKFSTYQLQKDQQLLLLTLLNNIVVTDIVKRWRRNDIGISDIDICIYGIIFGFKFYKKSNEIVLFKTEENWTVSKMKLIV